MAAWNLICPSTSALFLGGANNLYETFLSKIKRNWKREILERQSYGTWFCVLCPNSKASSTDFSFTYLVRKFCLIEKLWHTTYGDRSLFWIMRRIWGQADLDNFLLPNGAGYESHCWVIAGRWKWHGWSDALGMVAFSAIKLLPFQA